MPARSGDAPDTVSTLRPVILCGGQGARLWPLSSPARPKQHLALISGRSMIAETAARVAEARIDGLAFSAPLAVGSARMEAALKADLPGAALILEPEGRNSAAAIAAAALSSPEEALLLVLPADHHIGDVASFHAALLGGARAARAGQLVTFGVTPDHPATGYGYIEAGPEAGAGVHQARAFVEKPDANTARRYLEGGRHFWNAGVFLFEAGVMRAAFKRHARDILDAVALALPDAGPAPGAPARLSKTAFAKVRAQSIDYAVMEAAARDGAVSVAPVDMDWSDIGDHAALYALKRSRHRLDPGAALGEGPVHLQAAPGCYVRSDGPPVFVRGVKDLAVIAAPAGVLVTPLDQTADIRAGVDVIQTLGPTLALSPSACAAAGGWLRRALSIWADRAWDKKQGGFVEQLTLDGAPDADAPRRARVQPRQIFAFAQALHAGLLEEDRARALVTDGLAYVASRMRSGKGGFVHRIAGDGAVIDGRRDLYDHAFMALAGVWAWRATGETAGLSLMEEAFAFIDGALADPVHGGWREGVEADGSPDAGLRRANPHMHLLEASLAAHTLTGDAAHCDRALVIGDLFEQRFFDSPTGGLREFFKADWTLAEGEAGRRTEPGHAYEWAVLLHQLEQASGRDTASWRRRLIGFADETGREQTTGFAVNAVMLDGAPADPARRLWPQLEMLRARLIHPELAGPGEAERLLLALNDSYLSDGPVGGWMDAYDADGAQAAQAVPASMLYHMMTAFAPLAAADGVHKAAQADAPPA